jgi:hypothetical protein
VRQAGALLGSRADRLPQQVRRWCSLERRSEVALEPGSADPIPSPPR